MTSSEGNSHGSREPSSTNRVVQICGSFAAAWTAGHEPRLEDYLREFADAETAEGLSQLLTVELEYRRKLGSEPTVQEFLERFPSQRQTIYAAFDDFLPKTIDYASTAPTMVDQNVGSESPLAKFDLFSQPAFEKVESQMHEELYGEGEFLFHQGDPGNSLMLLCEGSVEVSTDDEWGKRHLIGRVNEGDVLGEMALLANEPRSANVIATTAVRVLVLPVDKFQRLAEEFPELSVTLTQLIAKRVGMQTRDVLVGKSLERYRVRQRLGRGGMGVVYEADDSETGQRVALKMMSHQLVYDAGGHERFQQEADIVESFEHENIVQMYRRFRAFHTAFIAMEYCDGETLHDRIRRNGRLTEAEARRVFCQVASAVGYAHARDIVHRDIKPDNIMINQDGVVKLMDFGLAQPIATTRSELTRRIVGTPGYMAPEQLTGRNSGKECDYFSLGCVGYEMLTGQRLCVVKTMSELLQRLTTWEVPDLKQDCPGVSQEFSQLVEGCLSKDPEARRIDFDLVATWNDQM